MDVTKPQRKKQQQPDLIARVGAPSFAFQRVTSKRLNFQAATTCLMCGEPVTVAYGAVGAVFKVGQEFVGVCCDDCLAPESQAKLAEMREAQKC